MKTTALNGVPVEATLPRDVHSVHGLLYHPEMPLLSDEDLLWMMFTHQIKTFEIFKRTTQGAVLRHGLKLSTTALLGWDTVAVPPSIPPPRRCQLCQHFGPTNQEYTEARVCARCSSTEHTEDMCFATPHCTNCNGPHGRGKHQRNAATRRRIKNHQRTPIQQQPHPTTLNLTVR